MSGSHASALHSKLCTAEAVIYYVALSRAKTGIFTARCYALAQTMLFEDVIIISVLGRIRQHNTTENLNHRQNVKTLLPSKRIISQSPPRCTKCNSPPINGKCTKFILFDVTLSLPLDSKGLTCSAQRHCQL